MLENGRTVEGQLLIWGRPQGETEGTSEEGLSYDETQELGWRQKHRYDTPQGPRDSERPRREGL